MSHPARILVVDDDPAVGLYVESVLKKAGYEVSVAADLSGAKEAAARSPLDVIVSDVVLGPVDGLDIDEAIKALQPNVKTLFMSGYARPRYGNGCDDPILVKPFEAAELLERVEAALASRHPQLAQ
jgi:two-component system response regulator MprA